MLCKNCGGNVDGKYCSHCGQNSNVSRINLPNFLNELSDSVFQVNRGLFFTIKELSMRPGHSIKEFIMGKRKNHFKPIAYALTLSTVYFILSQLVDKNTFLSDLVFGLSAGTEEVMVSDHFVSTLNWLASNYSYTTLLLIPVYALASKLAFIGNGYNYLEHVVPNSFIVGHQAIIYSIFLIPSLFIPEIYYVELLALSLSIIYAFWVFRQFFSEFKFAGVCLRFSLMYVLIFVVSSLVIFLFIVGSLNLS